MGNHVFVIDNEQDFVDSVKRALTQAGYWEVKTITNALEAARLFNHGTLCDIALIDVNMPGMNGVDLLELIKSVSPQTECIMITAINEAHLAVECMRKGAYDYLVKPVSRDDLILRMQHAQERRRLYAVLAVKNDSDYDLLNHPEAFAPIITQSPSMMKIMKESELHAISNVPVLISGESGTGKELLARAVHAASCRKDRPFIAVNMASMSGSLFDAEFFGHTKGAFTGAVNDRMGYLEYANRGTLFLDEVGSLPLELQGKLLRVLQEGEFAKIGTSRSQKADVRFIAATNVDLEKMVSRGQFRNDFYYRLKGAWLHLPALRERREDIPLLIDTFMLEGGISDRTGRMHPETLSCLMHYDYPGNIRELKSIIQGILNLAQGATITPNLLPEAVRRHNLSRSTQPSPTCTGTSLSEVEKAHILNVYQTAHQNKSEAARILGIGLNTLRRKLEEYAIT
jgi:two-component system response regulator AtoC